MKRLKIISCACVFRCLLQLSFLEYNVIIMEPIAEIHWNIATKKPFNTTDVSYYNLDDGDTNDNYNMQNLLDYGYPKNRYPYTSKDTSSFNIVIDLLIERRISSVIIKAQTLHNFYVDCYGKTKCVMKNPAEDTGDSNPHGGIIYMHKFTCNKMKARFVKINLSPEEAFFFHVHDIIIQTPIMLLQQKKFLNGSLTELSHPYDRPSSSSHSVFAQALHNFSHDDVSFSDVTPQYIHYYDLTPVVWYSIKSYHIMIVDQLILRSYYYDFPAFNMMYQTYDDRKFIEYKEDRKRKMFYGLQITNAWFIFYLENAILAKSMKIILLQYATPLRFKINLKGYKTIFFQKTWPYTIYSGNLTPFMSGDDINVASIDFGRVQTVVALLFDQYDLIEEFCLKYTNENGRVIDYKDQPTQSDITIFQPISREVRLRLFYAVSLQLRCMKLFHVDRFPVHVKGRNTSEMFHWVSGSFRSDKPGDDIFVAKDKQQSATLYSTEASFDKKLQEHRVVSDHLADDCLTRPDFCDEGFAVQFKVKGTIKQPLVDVYHVYAQHTTYIGLFNLLFQYDSVYKLGLIFHNAFLYSYAKIISAVIEFDVEKLDLKPVYGTVNLYLTSETYDKIRAMPSSYDYPFDIEFNDDETRGKINLTNALTIVLHTVKQEVRHIQLYFDTRDGKVQGYRHSTVLIMKTRVIVPKILKSIPSTLRRPDLFTLRVTLPNTYVVMQVCLYGKKEVPITFHHWFQTYTQFTIDLFNRDEPIILNTMEANELGCFDFPYPKILQEFRIKVATRGTPYSVDVRGADINFDDTEVFPIISAGLHGSLQKNTGTGFAIYYDDDNKIHGLVRTGFGKLHTSFSADKFEENVEYTVTMYWKKWQIKFYVNNEIKMSFATISNYISSKPNNISSEYLSIFGNSHSIFSYSQLTLLSVKVYYTANQSLIDEDTRQQTITNLNLHDDVIYDDSIHPSYDNCENKFCPYYDEYLQPVTAVYTIGKIPVYEIQDNLLQKLEVQMLSKVPDFTELSFLNVFNPYHKGRINSINIVLHFTVATNPEMQCKLFLLNDNTEFIVTIPAATHLHSVKITQYVVHIFETSKAVVKSLDFKLDESSCLVPGQAFVDASLEVTYSIGLNYQPRLVIYAHEGYASIFSINVFENTACVQMNYTFKGEGFAYLAVSTSEETNIGTEYSEIWRNMLKKGENEILSVTIPSSVENMPLELRFSVVKNFQGDGYFKVLAIVLSTYKCELYPNSIHSTVANDWFSIITRASLMRTGFLLASFSMGPNPRAMAIDGLSMNENYGEKRLQHFENPFGLTHYYYDNDWSFEVSYALVEFSIVVWLYCIRGTVDIVNIQTENLEILFKVSTNEEGFVFTIFGETFPFVCESKQKWVPVTATFMNKFLYLEVDQEIVAANQPVNFLNPSRLIYTVKSQRYIYCYQMYTSVLTKAKLQEALMCPSKFSENLCEDSLPCGRCSQLNGGFERYRLLGKRCKSKISQSTTVPDIYYALDDPAFTNGASTFNFVGDYNYTISAFTKGVLNRALQMNVNEIFKPTIPDILGCGSQCTIAFWLKHVCSDTDKYKYFITNFLIIQCSYKSMEFVTSSCGYITPVRNGFWYHVIVTLNSSDISDIFFNGEPVVFTKSCNIPFENTDHISLGFGGKVSVDEIFFINEMYMVDKAKEVYDFYSNPLFFGNDVQRRKRYPLWIMFYANDIDANKLGDKGTKLYANFTSFLKKATQDDTFIDFDERQYYKDGISTYFLIPVYLKKLSDEIINKIKSGFIGLGFINPQIVKANLENDLYTHLGKMTLPDQIKIVEKQKDSLTIQWEDSFHYSDITILGLQVEVIFQKHVISLDFVNTSISTQSIWSSMFTISGLNSYSMYKIDLQPITLIGRSSGTILPLGFFIEIETAESEPSKAPDVTCVPVNDTLHCSFVQLEDQYWNGIPHSYEIACLLKSTFIEAGETSIFLLNETIVGFQKHDLPLDVFGATFNTTEIFKLYTVETRAVTQSGVGKGIALQKEFRSQQGAPDSFPDQFEMSYGSNAISFSWIPYVDDVEYWNTNISYKDSWKFHFNLISAFSNIKTNFSVSPEAMQTGFMYDLNNDNLTDILKVELYAESNGKSSSILDNQCYIVPNDRVPTSTDMEVNTAVKNHETFQMKIKFTRLSWRGLGKYLYVVAVADRPENKILSASLIAKDSLQHDDNITTEKTAFVESSVSYWIRVYRHYIFVNDDVEENYTDKVILCTNETMNFLIQNQEVELEHKALLNGLHPFTNYLLYFQFCNNFGCSGNVYKHERKTDEFKPGAPPQNLTITTGENFIMDLNWVSVDPFHQNGIIVKYYINYTIMRLNETYLQTIDGNITHYATRNVGKYELVCFQISAATTVGLGPFSNISCNYSAEAAPDAIPSFKVISRTRSSLLLNIMKTNPLDLNGKLRYLIVNYNKSLNEYCNETFAVNHTAFMLHNGTYTVVLRNLLSYKYYDISMAFATIAWGQFSEKIINRTGIDSPAHPPRNFTVQFDAFTMNATWESLPEPSWNGPPLNYKVIIHSQLVDGSVNTTVLFVDPEKTSLEVNTLHPYMYFNVTIASCTILGCSDVAFQYFRTLEAEPCPPDELFRDDSILNNLCIYWSDIRDICKNGIIIGYVIHFKQIRSVPYTVENEFSIDIDNQCSKAHCIDNIPMGRIYNISVSGKTQAGFGLPSNEISVVFGEIINGNWAEWTEWTPCTSSCDNGTRSRKRFCTNPTPVNGLPCVGHDNETEDCVLPHCEGAYLTRPGDFDCSKLCSNMKLRCSGRVNTWNTTKIFSDLKLHCSSNSEKWKVYWADFHPAFDSKHQSCEGYVMKTSEINCNPPNDGSHGYIQRICDCEDPASEGLTAWYPWSPCLQDCGASLTRTRRRLCKPNYTCSKEAKTFDEMNCGLRPCPINGAWSEWRESTRCSKSCGGGYKVNVRTCTNPPPAHGGEKCKGPREDQGEVCNAQPCPVDGGMSLWTEWSSCDKPCGKPKRMRERFCNNPVPAYKGKPCNETREIEETNSECNHKECPEVEILLTLAITNQDWHYTMYQTWSPLALQLTENVCKNVNASLSTKTIMKDCRSVNIRQLVKKNGVTPTLKVLLKYVDQDQIVAMVNQIERVYHLSRLEISDHSINVTSIPFDPPRNIHVSILNKTSVNVSWTMFDQREKTPTVYIYYIEDEIEDKDANWHVKSVSSKQTYIILYYLKPLQLYKAYLVRSNEVGNGNPSAAFLIKTESSPPAIYPLNVKGFPFSSTSIYVTWNSIPNNWQNGFVSGYKIKYKKYFERDFQVKIIENGFLSSTITGLQPYTYYQVDVAGINVGGEGPADYVMVKTLEGVPSVPVPDVKVSDMQSISWWSVSWSPLPKSKIHGILKGYRLKYYLSYKSDVPIGREIEWIVRTFDKFTFYHKERNLESYGTYNLTVTGFTSVGEGPTPEHFAKTCRCGKHLFANWYELSPYATLKSQSNLTGLFPDLIDNVIISSCAKCASHDKSTLYFLKTKFGENARKKSDYELKLSINDDVDVSFPYYERISTQAIVPGSIFLPIIKSTGCAFITRDEVNLNELVINLILNVVKVWPLLVVSYAIAAVCGILIWASEQFVNPAEFNLGDSIKGPCVGFWFSFISMTTVGYGDLTPKSKVGRVFSVVWFFIGLILNGIVVGFITTALTTLDQPDKIKLYNTKTATLADSYEYRFAVRRNAEVPDKQYSSIDEMLDDLQDKKVDAILVDLFSMVGYKDKISSRFLKVKTILDTQTAYGIILSGRTVRLKNDIEGRIFESQTMLANFKQSVEDDIPQINEAKRGEVMQLVFGPDSPIYETSAILMAQIFGTLLFFGVVYEVIRCIRQRSKVHPPGDKFLNSLEKDVETFKNNVMNNIIDLDSRQEKERVKLCLLNHAVKNLETKVGKDAARVRIRSLWD